MEKANEAIQGRFNVFNYQNGGKSVDNILDLDLKLVALTQSATEPGGPAAHPENLLHSTARAGVSTGFRV